MVRSLLLPVARCDGRGVCSVALAWASGIFRGTQTPTRNMPNIRRLLAATAVAIVSASTMEAQNPPAAGAPRPTPMILTISAWPDGGVIPPRFTQAGEQTSPELKWTNVPAGTQSFVVNMLDPDVSIQRGTETQPHWIVWNIQGSATGLPEGVKPGAELPDGMRQIERVGTAISWARSGREWTAAPLHLRGVRARHQDRRVGVDGRDARCRGAGNTGRRDEGDPRSCDRQSSVRWTLPSPGVKPCPSCRPAFPSSSPPRCALDRSLRPSNRSTSSKCRTTPCVTRANTCASTRRTRRATRSRRCAGSRGSSNRKAFRSTPRRPRRGVATSGRGSRAAVSRRWCCCITWTSCRPIRSTGAPIRSPRRT